MSIYSWDWAKGGVKIFCGKKSVGYVPTDHPSRVGADLVGLGMKGRLQISWHGCNRYSAQVFAPNGKLLHDADIAL